jgi:succinate dehydrogenase/fumarate reductase flavoprotein subunit
MMARSSEEDSLIVTDVLVVGGGAAGLWAANAAQASEVKVVVVDKGPRDWGGLASMAGGDFDASLPGENPEDFVKDLVYYYDGLCDQELVEAIFAQSYERMRDYQSLGCEFLTDADGNLRGIPQRSLDHVKLYPAKLKAKGGADMVAGLVKEASRLGVERIGRTVITDLLKDNGRIIGAVGFDIRSGAFRVFQAKAVVLATGQGGWKSTKNMTSGEGIWVGAKAGCEVKNCEFAQIWNFPPKYEWEGQTKFLPLGARFVNSLGDSFMEKYSPRFGANTDPHYNVRGMVLEIREGRGPIYLDLSAIEKEHIELLKPQTGWQLINYERMVKNGEDFFKDRIEYEPLPVSCYGGLVAEVSGATAVPGLFAAGKARSLDAGVYMGGFALCSTAVTGFIAGRTVAEYVRSSGQGRLQHDEILGLKERWVGLLGKHGIAPKRVLTAIQEAVFPYDVCILKSRSGLERALDSLREIRDDMLPRMTAEDPHYLLKAVEVYGVAFITECFLKASLLRTESRAGHFREDYPARDDENWLQWIAIALDKGQLRLRTVPVPIEKYKFKPTRFYMDNFRFPKACVGD